MKYAERSKRLNIIGALNKNCFFAPFVFEGPCTRDIFEIYLSKILMKSLPPNKILVLDNASFHKGGFIAVIAKNAQCQLNYLPSYSPDLNPIEHHWHAIKTRLRKNLQETNRDVYHAAIKTFELGIN